MQFQRLQSPPAKKKYQDYKPYLRQDFQYRCAYCLIHEAHYGGLRNFHVDHFRPKSRPEFRALTLAYTNLYYACGLCNTNKGHTWPADDLLKQGFRFLDPCEEDPFLAHLTINDQDGSLLTHTPPGAYTAHHLRLNRNQLKRHRRRQIEAQHKCAEARTLLASATLLPDQRAAIQSVLADIETDYLAPPPPYDPDDLQR